jgi:hypothetical protein
VQIFVAKRAYCSHTPKYANVIWRTLIGGLDMAKKPEAKPKEAAPKPAGKATGDKGKKGGKK